MGCHTSKPEAPKVILTIENYQDEIIFPDSDSELYSSGVADAMLTYS